MNVAIPLPPQIDEGPPPVRSPSSMNNYMLPPTITKESDAKLCIDWMKSPDLSARVTAANRMAQVAQVLGPQRSRDELLPFLTEGTDDEDDVLLALASRLGDLLVAIGGSEYAHLLLPPLEHLLVVEEAAVRQAALESSRDIIRSMADDYVRTNLAQMILRLATREWFTARMSSIPLMVQVFVRLMDKQQSQCLTRFYELCRDSTPMVRRVAAQHLGAMMELLHHTEGRRVLAIDQAVATTFVPLLEALSAMDQPDSVRLQTTQNCVSFGAVLSSLDMPLTDDEIQLLQGILPLVVSTIDDRSWRVRWTAAHKFADVVDAYEALPQAMDALVPAYEKLLQDPEAEVRTAATMNLAKVAGCDALVEVGGTRVTVAERLVKRVTNLTEDDSEHVRAALAMVATALAPRLGREGTISHLVPPVLLLLRDAASEVRLNLISSLSALNEVIGVDLLSQSLLPAILDLAQDGKWRIRLAIIGHVPMLAQQLGQDFFTERLTNLCVGWIGDDIATIREAAATNLRELVHTFGTEWALHNLLPAIEHFRNSHSYLQRITALHAFSRMAQAMDTDAVRLRIMPILLEMANDIVPNIRFNVAKELGVLAPICGKPTYESQIVPVLELLAQDEDRDVRYFAVETASSLQASMSAKVSG